MVFDPPENSAGFAVIPSPVMRHRDPERSRDVGPLRAAPKAALAKK